MCFLWVKGITKTRGSYALDGIIVFFGLQRVNKKHVLGEYKHLIIFILHRKNQSAFKRIMLYDDNEFSFKYDYFGIADCSQIVANVNLSPTLDLHENIPYF